METRSERKGLPSLERASGSGIVGGRLGDAYENPSAMADQRKGDRTNTGHA